MLTAKEAQEKAREALARQEEEKTKKYEKNYEDLLERIRRAAFSGDFEVRTDSDKLSSEHLGRLEAFGYTIKKIEGPWYEISWRFADLKG